MKEDKKKASKRGKNNRRRGHNFERVIAREFQEIGYPEARRQLEYHEDDANGIDLQGTGEYDVQTKKRKDYASVSTINEIKGKGIPVVITAADRKEPMAIIPWKDLKELLALESTVNQMQVVSFRTRTLPFPQPKGGRVVKISRIYENIPAQDVFQTRANKKKRKGKEL